MRVVWIAGLFLTGMLAGCSGTPSQEELDSTFDDVQVHVGDDTGAILGVVVNDAIVPVADATVAFVGQERATLTDDQGRFPESAEAVAAAQENAR